MLRKYDPLDEVVDEVYFRQYVHVPLRHLASELIEEYGYRNQEELDEALTRTFEVCCIMDIPIKQHFKAVYVCEGSGLKKDWLLSDLGSYLLLINGNSGNPNVARARLYLLTLAEKH